MSNIAIEPCGFWLRSIESPQRPALIRPGGETITYGTLFARVNRTTRLLASLGLVEGDHLTFAQGQRPEIFEIVLACSQLDVWYTPASARLSTDELTYPFVDSTSSAAAPAASVAFVASGGGSEMGKLQRRKLRADSPAAIASSVVNPAGGS